MNKGAIVSAKKSRERSLERYYKNPNFCLSCKKIIKVNVEQRASDVKKKKFCNRGCFVKHNRNKLISICLENAIRNLEKPKAERVCKGCKKSFYGRKDKLFCESCSDGRKLENKKISECSHSSVRSHSRYVMKQTNRDLKCEECGYDKFVEVCHLRPVRDFSKESLLKTVNSIENLKLLCPNCHWEFDNKK